MIGVRLPAGVQDPDRLWSPPSFLTNGYLGFAPQRGFKRKGHEADHTPLSSAKIINASGKYTSTPNVHSRKQKLAALYMPMAGQAVQLLP
jgi:hypothetical protein